MEKNNFFSGLLNLDFNSETIEVLGYKLHFDDLLLVCILFCLYKEGIEDQFLFISLILLLFT